MRQSVLFAAVAAVIVSGAAASLLLEPTQLIDISTGRNLLEQRSDKMAKSGEEKVDIPTREERCQAAIDAHRYAMQAQGLGSGSLEDSVEVSDQMVNLMKQLKVQVTRSKQSNLMPIFDETPHASWANEIFQWVFSNNLALPSSQVGEMMYVANQWMGDIAALPANISDLGESAFMLWSQRWYDYADNIFDQALGMQDDISKRGMFMRVLNYYFAGFYPYPLAKQSEYRLQQAESIFRTALELFTAYDTTYFNATYNNGTATAELPAMFITPASGTKLPVMIFSTSVHNWKEMLFVRYGPGAMRRDYAVVFVDGPGMGPVVREKPHMPVSSDYTKVIESVLDAMDEDKSISSSYDPDRVVLMGASIGGYLTAQACAGLADRLAACVLNPGFVDLSSAYNKIFMSSFYSDLSVVAQISPSAVPEQYLDMFLNPYDYILIPLLNDCTEDSDAAEAFAESFRGGVLSPTYAHMVIGFMGLDPTKLTLDEVPDHLWEAYRRLNWEFNGFSFANMTVPVMTLVGIMDGLAGQQVNQLYAMLPEESKALSKLQIFDVASGGALPSQLGAFALFEQTVYPWLDTVMAAAKI